VLQKKLHLVALGVRPPVSSSVILRKANLRMNVQRTGIVLKPNIARVVLRPFHMASELRAEHNIARVAALSEPEVEQKLGLVLRDFGARHLRTIDFLANRYQQVRKHNLTDLPDSLNRQLLIGSYFSLEYALESAALFNPSMMWHPDQSHLPPDHRRFIVSLRATGEGHLSSIVFRSGVVDAQCGIHLDDASPFAVAPELVPNSLYEKALFQRKITELGFVGPLAEEVMNALGDTFTLDELERAIRQLLKIHRHRQREFEPIANTMLIVARANYETRFDPSVKIAERVIFPSSPTETNGIEDARFVRFTYPEGRIVYYAPYTAYDGRVTLPQILETEDFLHFKVGTLNGPEVRNKGFALFPRLIHGHYAMLSRQDNENIYVMYSDQLHFWHAKELVARPTYPWEFVQLGNCGSPIETDEGWLVLTHGVGPMRRYTMGAYLLDLNTPAKLIGRLEQPLLEPDEQEREGYVPNVVYSCGSVVHNEQLIIPFAMSDHSSSFVTVALKEVLAAMKRE
jgi:predicted GH43/DUF377 family glycosyl hydrolase